MDQNTQEEVMTEDQAKINGVPVVENMPVFDPEAFETAKQVEYRERSQKLDEMALDNALGLQVLLSRELQGYFDSTGAPTAKKAQS